MCQQHELFGGVWDPSTIGMREVRSMTEAAKLVHGYSPLELQGLDGSRFFVQERALIIVTARLPELGRVKVTESKAPPGYQRDHVRVWRSLKGSKLVELRVVSVRGGIPALLKWSRQCPEVFQTRITWVEGGTQVAVVGEVLRPSEAVHLANSL